MLFNPLGGFVPHAPLDASALLAARKTVTLLPSLADGRFDRLYGHWQAGAWGCTDANYNGETDLVNGAWAHVITHDPRDNARQISGDMSYAAHTFGRNSFAFGASITGMNEASTTDFGPCPVQLYELEFFCSLAAAVAKKYGIDVSGTSGGAHPGEPNFATHAECAVWDGYPSERWDFGCLCPLPPGVQLTPAMRTQSADALRVRIHTYNLAL